MSVLQDYITPRPLAEWHDELGDVLWWRFPIEEPPYCGSPQDCGQTIEIVLRRHGVEDSIRRHSVGGWPGYHTHWTPIHYPDSPPAPAVDPAEG